MPPKQGNLVDKYDPTKITHEIEKIKKNHEVRDLIMEYLYIFFTIG